jgi:hypothetical protein
MPRFLACVLLVLAYGALSAQESTPSPAHNYFGERERRGGAAEPRRVRRGSQQAPEPLPRRKRQDMLWKKLFGLAKVEDIFESVDSVVNDK